MQTVDRHASAGKCVCDFDLCTHNPENVISVICGSGSK